MRKKQLEIILSQLASSPSPRLKWEAYALDSISAAEMVHMAAIENNDIRGKEVVDLGCGSGILAIAASLLKAKWVVGVDINKESIQTAKMNAENVGASADLIAGDIECVLHHFDTTLMNPPFGSWKRGADIQFLKKALSISDVVYSLHKRNESVRVFLGRKIPSLGGQLDQIRELEVVLSRIYSFHKKRKYPVKADLYRILKASTSYGSNIENQP